MTCYCCDSTETVLMASGVRLCGFCQKRYAPTQYTQSEAEDIASQETQPAFHYPPPLPAEPTTDPIGYSRCACGNFFHVNGAVTTCDTCAGQASFAFP